MIVAIGGARIGRVAGVGGRRVAKPEWGTKRVCGSCGTRFYDLNRKPVVCPKCEAEPPADQPVKGQRRVVAAPEPEPASTAADKSASAAADKSASAAADESASDEDEQLAEPEDKDKATEKHEFIEDASELGEDEDDMAEVLEGTVEKDEGER
jgi:uncharacterized protein (TIGR02300 family)